MNGIFLASIVICPHVQITGTWENPNPRKKGDNL